jgi:hypothetical protein
MQLLLTFIALLLMRGSMHPGSVPLDNIGGPMAIVHRPPHFVTSRRVVDDIGARR